MKFAVLKTGNKQYLVNEGKTLKIEKISGDFSVGSKVTFSDVLLASDGENITIGKPTTGGKVEAEIVSIGTHDKIDVIRYMPKSRWYKKNGHKQPYFEIKILSI
jgi:large subunit ribosomal protein L21